MAVFYAHHQQWSIDRTVEETIRPEAACTPGPRRSNGNCTDTMLSWGANVASWVEADLPVHVARCEDLLPDPVESFGAVVWFTGLEWSRSRLARAVDHARFDRLRAQEEREGFRLRQPTAPSFFRPGRSGDWRTALTPRQVRALVEAHGPVMERFGYLEEAEAFLAGAAPAG